MNKNQFKNLYLDKCVHCATEKQAIEFLKLCSSFGFPLYGYLYGYGGPSTSPNNYWEDYEENTIYYVRLNDISNGIINDEIHSNNPRRWEVVEFDNSNKFYKAKHHNRGNMSM